MGTGAGDRGVSEVMGFILVFGMLVIAFTVYQGIIVPDQNRQVEFQHNQAVQGQLQDLRNAIVTTAATGTGQAVSVTLGASYPRRALAQNLGVSGGSIQTIDAGGGPIRIGNARAIDGETADYLDGSERTFETKSVRYTPVYTFYSAAPATVYENSLVYNQFGGANLTTTDQVVVDGRRITLIALNGSLTRTERDTVSVSTEAISSSSNRVAVRNTSGERLNVTIPTRLSVAKWEEVLAEEMGSGGYVEDVTEAPGGHAVIVSMDQGVTYELRMAKVGLGSGTAEEPPEYVIDVVGDDVSVPEDGTQQIVVEVRDRFNNPVSNVMVSVGTPSEGSVSPSTGTTVTDGRATFIYSAPSDVNGAQDVDVPASFGGGGQPPQSVTFDIRVLDTDGSGGGGAGTSADQFVGSTGSSTSSGSAADVFGNNADESVSFDVSNTGPGPVSITGLRVEVTSGGGAAQIDKSTGGTGPYQNEIYVGVDSGTDGSADDANQGGTFDLGEDIPLDTNAEVDDGSDATVYLTRFQNNGGSDVDMSGETIDVTFYFADGSQKTITVDT